MQQQKPCRAKKKKKKNNTNPKEAAWKNTGRIVAVAPRLPVQNSWVLGGFPQRFHCPGRRGEPQQASPLWTSAAFANEDPTVLTEADPSCRISSSGLVVAAGRPAPRGPRGGYRPLSEIGMPQRPAIYRTRAATALFPPPTPGVATFSHHYWGLCCCSEPCPQSPTSHFHCHPWGHAATTLRPAPTGPSSGL